MIKAVFLDIDWTLLSHNTNSIPKSAIEAIKHYQEKGIKFYMATGRNSYELQFLNLNGINFDGYITINGQLIMDKDKNIIHKETMKNTDSLIKEFKKKDVPIMFVEDNLAYVNTLNDFVKQAMDAISTPYPKELKFTGREFCQAILFADEIEAPKYIKRFPNFDFLRWHPMAIDIVVKNVDKVEGIKKLGYKKEEIMAIGDGENDIKMIQYAHIGVAMGNGSPETKACANFITDDVDTDGLAKALYKFL